MKNYKNKTEWFSSAAVLGGGSVWTGSNSSIKEKETLFAITKTDVRNGFITLVFVLSGLIIAFAIAALLTAAITVFIICPYKIVKNYKKIKLAMPNIGIM